MNTLTVIILDPLSREILLFMHIRIWGIRFIDVNSSLNQIFSYLSITACLLPKQKYIFFYIMQGLYNYFKNLSTFAKTLKKISTCFVFFTAWQNVKLGWKKTQKSCIIIAMMNAELRNYRTSSLRLTSSINFSLLFM